MFCNKCGAQNPDHAKFCYSCGEKLMAISEEGQVTKETQNNDCQSRQIGSLNDFSEEELKIYKNVVEGLGSAKKSAIKCLENAFKASEEVNLNIEANVNTLNQVASDIIHDIADCGATQLQKNGIYSYLAEDISYALQRHFSFEDEISDFIEAHNSILEYESNIDQNRKKERQSRSYWQGGGFGITGAIKGAITADIMNAGTSAVRGITDSVVNFFDNRDKKRYSRQVLENLDTAEIFSNAVVKASEEVLLVVLEILVKERVLPFYRFREEKNNCLRELKGITNAFHKELLSEEEYQSKLMRLIDQYPNITELYGLYYSMFGDGDKAALEIIAKVGHKDDYKEVVNEYYENAVYPVVLEALSNLASNREAIEQRITYLEEADANNPFGTYNTRYIEALKKKCDIISKTKELADYRMSQYLGKAMFRNMKELWRLVEESESDRAFLEVLILKIYTEGLAKRPEWGSENMLSCWPICDILCESEKYKESATANAIVALLNLDKENYNVKRCARKYDWNLDTEKSPLAVYVKHLIFETQKKTKESEQNSDEYLQKAIDMGCPLALQKYAIMSQNAVNVIVENADTNLAAIEEILDLGYTSLCVVANESNFQKQVIDLCVKPSELEKHGVKNEEIYSAISNYYMKFMLKAYSCMNIVHGSDYDEERALHKYLKWSTEEQRRPTFIKYAEHELNKMSGIDDRCFPDEWEEWRNCYYEGISEMKECLFEVKKYNLPNLYTVNNIDELQVLWKECQKSMEEMHLCEDDVPEYVERYHQLEKEVLERQNDEITKSDASKVEDISNDGDAEINSATTNQECKSEENNVEFDVSKAKETKKRSLAFRIINVIWKIITVALALFMIYVGALGIIRSSGMYISCALCIFTGVFL